MRWITCACGNDACEIGASSAAATLTASDIVFICFLLAFVRTMTRARTRRKVSNAVVIRE
jgi:hypothetical protein